MRTVTYVTVARLCRDRVALRSTETHLLKNAIISHAYAIVIHLIGALMKFNNSEKI